MDPWQMWVLLGIGLFVGEIFTPAFVLAAFGVGSFGSAIAAYAGLSFPLQILTFSLVTLGTFVGIRPFVLEHLASGGEEYRSNVDALIGKEGVVTEAIDPGRSTGRVRVGGEDWKALASPAAPVEAGSTVRVVRVDGASLIVAPANQREETAR